MPCLVKCATLSMDEGYQMNELIIIIVHFKSHFMNIQSYISCLFYTKELLSMNTKAESKTQRSKSLNGNHTFWASFFTELHSRFKSKAVEKLPQRFLTSSQSRESLGFHMMPLDASTDKHLKKQCDDTLVYKQP